MIYLKGLAFTLFIFISFTSVAKQFTYIKYDSVSTELIYTTIDIKRRLWKSSGLDERISIKLEDGSSLDLFTKDLWGYIYNSTGRKGNLDTFLIVKDYAKKYSKVLKYRDGDLNKAALFQKEKTYYLIYMFFYYYDYYIVIDKTQVIKLPKSKEKIANLLADTCWASRIRNYEKGFLNLLAADKKVESVPIMSLYEECENEDWAKGFTIK